MTAPVYALFRSPLGWIGLAAHARGLVRITVPYRLRRQARAELAAHGITRPGTNQHIEAAQRALGRYFVNPRRANLSKLVLDWTRATAFERAVWQRVQPIPLGTTSTYGAVTRALGRPRAARAVGVCNAKNPFAIVMPCHRLIGGDGSLRGYRGSLDMKKRLLEWEGIDLAALRAKRLVAGPVPARRAHAHRN